MCTPQMDHACTMCKCSLPSFSLPCLPPTLFGCLFTLILTLLSIPLVSPTRLLSPLACLILSYCLLACFSTSYYESAFLRALQLSLSHENSRPICDSQLPTLLQLANCVLSLSIFVVVVVFFFSVVVSLSYPQLLLLLLLPLLQLRLNIQHRVFQLRFNLRTRSTKLIQTQLDIQFEPVIFFSLVDLIQASQPITDVSCSLFGIFSDIYNRYLNELIDALDLRKILSYVVYVYCCS